MSENTTSVGEHHLERELGTINDRGDGEMRSLHTSGLKTLFKLADLPNTLGFKFIGVNRGWQEVDCIVAYSEGKGFYVEGEDFSYLQGWKQSRGEA